MPELSALDLLTLLCAIACGLSAGFFFAFSAGVMQALGKLPPAQGIAAMQSINVAVINPWFMALFFGAPAACLLAIVASVMQWQDPRAVWWLAGGLLYVVGTFLVTMLCNVPRNNALAAVGPTSADGARMWSAYLTEWTAWNHVRTIAALAAAVCFGVASGTASASTPAPQDFRVIAYVAGWSMPATIHPEKLTHINFAFARIDGSGQVVFEDPKFVPALKTLLALKQQNPQLKVIVSVGGWEADGFSDAALTEASRNTFAESVVELLRTHGADGIDLDWEYPGQGVAGIQYRAEDKQNFTLLLETVRAQLDAASDADGRSGRDRYLLTIASADREYFDHTEMDKLHVHLDWLNIMSYDFFNSLTATTGHHAGLYASEFAAPRDRNADASVRQHLAAGIPPGKLVLGVAFYGRGFAGVNPANNGVHQPYERYEGDHRYADLADKLIGSQGFVRYWDERARAPFLWNGVAKLFITYEDPQSIRAKADYVRDNRLGGMMFWELSQDRNDELLDAILMKLVNRRGPADLVADDQ